MCAVCGGTRRVPPRFPLCSLVSRSLVLSTAVLLLSSFLPHCTPLSHASPRVYVQTFELAKRFPGRSIACAAAALITTCRSHPPLHLLCSNRRGGVCFGYTDRPTFESGRESVLGKAQCRDRDAQQLIMCITVNRTPKTHTYSLEQPAQRRVSLLCPRASCGLRGLRNCIRIRSTAPAHLSALSHCSCLAFCVPKHSKMR